MNLPAFNISLLVTWLLVIGTKESAFVNAVLVMVKTAARPCSWCWRSR